MIFSKKAKCTGCAALGTHQIEDKEVLFCRAGVDISYKLAVGKGIQPKPKESCYKPLTEADLVKATNLMLKRKQGTADEKP